MGFKGRTFCHSHRHREWPLPFSLSAARVVGNRRGGLFVDNGFNIPPTAPSTAPSIKQQIDTRHDDTSWH